MGIEDSAGIWDQMDAVAGDFRRMFPSFSFDMESVLADIMEGRLWEALKKLGGGISGAVLFEWEEYRTLFLTILVLGAAAALFSNFADLFQDHQVSDMAFYFVYLLLIAVLLKFFADTAGTVREVLNQMATFIKLYIPTYILAVGSASGAASASVYYQLLLIVVYLIEWGYLTVLLPFVYGYVMLAVVNGIWMEEKLALLLELAEKVIKGSVKASIWLITGFGLLQSMISPVIDSLQASAVKKALSAIPGMGGVAENMLEMVAGSAVLLKNSLGIFLTLALIVLCAAPVLKAAMAACVLKLGAAVIGMVTDKRLTNCANRVGEGSLMLLQMVLASLGMFVIQAAVISYSVGQTVR